VGSFGIWGEGHTKTVYSRDTRKQHIEMHAHHFKSTLIALNDDLGKDPGKSARLDDLIPDTGRYTLRDDSILVNSNSRAYRSAHLAERFWPKEPVILESEHYGGNGGSAHWDHGAKYAESVEAYRASYISIHWYPREFLAENKELVRKINLRLGYRLNLLEASWPETILLGNEFAFVSKWRNAGVAPCYPGGFVALTFKTAKDGIVAVFVDESWNFRTLEVDQTGPESKVVEFNDGGSKENGKDPLRSIALPIPGSAPSQELRSSFRLSEVVKAGKYQVFISVGERDGTPKLELPLKDHDGHRRYRLGSVEVK
jgi:hypothetical protein